MKESKSKIYIIPGLGESTRIRAYQEIKKTAQKRGFVVVPVNIDWSDTMTISDYIAQAEEKIPSNITQDYILGFSFGAYIALVLSEKRKAKGYFFCSVSPYFKENISDIPLESKKYFGKKFINSLKKYSYPAGSDSEAQFFIGSKDWKLAISTAKELNKKWRGKSALTVIPDVGHEFGNFNYLSEIKKQIKML